MRPPHVRREPDPLAEQIVGAAVLVLWFVALALFLALTP
jgi:hypothetical protein